MKIIRLIFPVILINLFITVKAYSKVATDISIEEELKQIPQNCKEFIQTNKKNQTYSIRKVKESYLRKYRLPWTNPEKIYEVDYIKKFIEKRTKKFMEKPGWGANKKPNDLSWIQKINRNIDLSTFPNTLKAGISIKDTNMRILPSQTPSFTNWVDAGEGYPFDNLQDSLLQAFEPIYILHVTKDGVWSLVLDAHKTCSWVKSKEIAYVSEEFRNQWNIRNYIITVQDGESIRDKETNNYVTTSRIGQILPLIGESRDDYEILYVTSDKKGNAEIEKGKISKFVTTKFPLRYNQLNISKIANNLMSSKYGWGGIYGYRDCSSILKDIFATFGVFLPRESGPQSKSGIFIDLSNVNPEEKSKKIIELGIPFLSIIYMPGHIMLYIGSKNEKPYIYHNIWGFKTMSNNIEGRAVFGRTVIMPLDLIYSNFENIPASYYKRVKGITLLDKHLYNPDEN